MCRPAWTGASEPARQPRVHRLRPANAQVSGHDRDDRGAHDASRWYAECASISIMRCSTSSSTRWRRSDRTRARSVVRVGRARAERGSFSGGRWTRRAAPVRDRLFEPFVTTKTEIGPLAGLGLCRRPGATDRPSGRHGGAQPNQHRVRASATDAVEPLIRWPRHRAPMPRAIAVAAITMRTTSRPRRS